MSFEDRAIAQSLVKYEKIIERGAKVFLEVGAALAAIRDGKLYSLSHKTFEAYCQERWGFERAHAYRLIESAEVIENLSPMGDKIDLPTNERQLREIARAPKEKQAEVVAKVAEKAAAEDRKPTAKDYKQAAAEVVYEDSKPTERNLDDEELPEDETIEEVCERESSEIESWARRLSSLLTEAQKAMSEFPTLDELNARTGWERKLKEALSTLRNTKPVVCPMCDGDNKKCTCKGHGRVTKQQYKQMV